MATTKSASAAVAPPTKTKKTKSAAAVKETKAKKSAVSAAKMSSVAHPTFLEMITDAIVTLKERTGSSHYAINKFIEEKHKKSLPVNFKKLLLIRLKKLVGDGKLVKVKNSFKIPAARSSAPATTKKKLAKVAAAVKPTSKVVKPKAKDMKLKAATEAKPKKKSPTAEALSVKAKKIVKSSAVKKPKAKSIRLPVKKAPAAKKAKK